MDNFDICVEVILLLSFITSIEKQKFKKELEYSKNFMIVISKLIETYSKDDDLKVILSKTISQLPIEELKYSI